MAFPLRINLAAPIGDVEIQHFLGLWQAIMERECHRHEVWQSRFVRALKDPTTAPEIRFQLAAVWASNMVSGSYCFPRYVAALAARAECDAVRHGLLENAWDESGGVHHAARSHFWLAVRLARLLGLGEHEIGELQPLPEAARYTEEHFRTCAEEDFEVGLGMICLIEEFTTPEFSMVFQAFLASSEDGLGLTQGEFVLRGGAEYFTANISDDERHREEMPRLLAATLRSRGVDLSRIDLEKALARVIIGVRRGIDLRAHFFEGVFEHVSSGGTYRDLVGV